MFRGVVGYVVEKFIFIFFGIYEGVYAIMGCVCKVYKGGNHIGYQARIVRVGLPKFTLSFLTYEQARDWLDANEESYIRNPSKYLGMNRIDALRDRRKKRNGRI